MSGSQFHVGGWGDGVDVSHTIPSVSSSTVNNDCVDGVKMNPRRMDSTRADIGVCSTHFLCSALDPCGVVGCRAAVGSKDLPRTSLSISEWSHSPADCERDSVGECGKGT